MSKRIKREWQKNWEIGANEVKERGKSTVGTPDQGIQVCGHKFCDKWKKWWDSTVSLVRTQIGLEMSYSNPRHIAKESV